MLCLLAGCPQVVSSLQRRVDEGHAQLASLQQLGRQKQRLLGAGGGVLAQHCRDTWGQAGAASAAAAAGEGAAGSGGGGDSCGIEVSGLRAEYCGSGQWRLEAQLQGLAEGVLRWVAEVGRLVYKLGCGKAARS